MARTKEQERLYNSNAWKKCRDGYIRHVAYICERCRRKYPDNPELWNTAEIVHHVIHLDADNADNPNVALNYDNLEALCRECHTEEHPELWNKKSDRFMVDSDGNVIISML